MVADRVKINNIFVAKFENDSVPKPDRKRPEFPKAAVEFVGIKRGVKKIFPKKRFCFLACQFEVSGQFLILTPKFGGIENLH